MKKQFTSRYLCCSILMTMIVSNENVWGQDPLPKRKQELQENKTVEANSCTKETLMTFFPPFIVKSILIRNQIAADQAEEIAKELAQKDSEIIQLVEKKASQMDSNPFKDLSQRDVAIKLFRDTLQNVFTEVVKKHGITNEQQIHTLLMDIQEAKGKTLIECLRKDGIKGNELNKL